MTDWPLQNICEPHETNDVLLLKKRKEILAQYPSAEGPQYTYYKGNQRFHELLMERQEEYK